MISRQDAKAAKTNPALPVGNRYPRRAARQGPLYGAQPAPYLSQQACALVVQK